MTMEMVDVKIYEVCEKERKYEISINQQDLGKILEKAWVQF